MLRTVVGRRKVFFSEEKNQKTFSVLSRTLQAAHTPEFAKVYCFFSSEKKAFLSYKHGLPRAPPGISARTAWPPEDP